MAIRLEREVPEEGVAVGKGPACIRIHRILGLVLLGFSVMACDPRRHVVHGAGSTVREIQVTVGEQVTLLESGELGLTYFNDEAVAVIQREPTVKLLTAALRSSYLIEGEDLLNLTSATQVMTAGGPGEFDNGYAGMAGVYEHDDGLLYGFYHAEDHVGMGTLPGGIPGFYARVGSAVSEDGGHTWEKLGPIIESAKPKEWSFWPEQADKGAGTPSVVVDRSGEYLLAYATEHSQVDAHDEWRGVQVIMARSRIADGPPVPGTWSKYYEGGFSEHALGGGLDSVVLSVFDRDEAAAIQPHVVFSDELDLYVMLLNVHDWREEVVAKSGIHIAFSEDGIRWTEPEALIIDHSTPVWGESISWQASIIWDAGSRGEGWMVYGHSPAWGWGIYGTIPHYMVGRRIALELEHVRRTDADGDAALRVRVDSQAPFE